MRPISHILFRLQGISLKWKIMIPFLLFSFVGTVVLAYIGLGSQQELIRQEEKKEILNFYRLFLTRISHRGEQALSMATIIAGDPRAQSCLANRDGDSLLANMTPLYQRLREDFGIQQLHFHVPPGKSFLRVHQPELSGEMISKGHHGRHEERPGDRHL